jgi:hypothetical protein
MATQSIVTDLLAAARTLSLQLIVGYAGTDSDLEAAREPATLCSPAASVIVLFRHEAAGLARP